MIYDTTSYSGGFSFGPPDFEAYLLQCDFESFAVVIDKEVPSPQHMSPPTVRRLPHKMSVCFKLVLFLLA